MNNPLKVIYTSSYDRGLEHLLKIWPAVKEAVPEAELHIYYGWTLWDKFYKDNPSSMAWKAKIERGMEYDGVTHHGRVSQEEINKAMSECGIWAYPTHFGEINCITAMKAQALGCVPVTMNYAALETTVQHGIKIDGDIYDDETREEFTKELISLLQDPKRQEEIRAEMVPWANEKFTWKKVAASWDEEFKK